MTEPITVFLLDDHEVVREGLRSLLEADGGMPASAGTFDLGRFSERP